MRRVAAAQDLRTVGDFLEFRFGVSVRTAIAALLWVGAVFILAGQLIAIATILDAIVGAPSVVGCTIGGLLITIYFTAGGLLTSAWVNVVQLTVKMVGFAIALPLALSAAGGWRAAARDAARARTTGTCGSGGRSGLRVSRDAGAGVRRSRPDCCRRSTARATIAPSASASALNALGLALYAMVPVVMGMIARLQFPRSRRRRSSRCRRCCCTACRRPSARSGSPRCSPRS